MKCPNCGSIDHTIRGGPPRTMVSIELDQVKRTRECDKCGHRWDTIELLQSEVIRLRLAAHTLTMQGVEPKRTNKRWRECKDS